jgi:16S rRNA (guanine527-N7)-methyltransferase
MSDALKSLLQEGLEQFNLAALCDPLSEYLALLNQWNKAYNLTSIRDPKEMVSKHVLDSLAINPWLEGHRILDVGTGPGLPGIPLALANPKVHFVLLDCNGKKTRFLQQVIRHLKLSNAEVVLIRAENYHPAPGFDTVLTRAFSSLGDFITTTEHLIAKHGLWLAMKGKYPEEELQAITHPYRIQHYRVDGLEGQRCCVLIQK